MNYRSVASLNRDILDWLSGLPRDVEVIAGVPRSGLLAANLLALHMNLPLTDVEGLLAGRLLAGGQRIASGMSTDFLKSPRNVLIVDDSLCTGAQMRAIRQRVAAAGTIHRVRYGAVYVGRAREKDVDFYAQVVPHPRIFEWNVMHGWALSLACVDIDGILCRDPTEDENDDGDRYRFFISNVEPRVIPTRRVGWLVTCRLEKYRALTEAWLAKNGIQYDRLVMMDLPDKAARVAARSYGAFKAAAYTASKMQLFIESSMGQAVEIAKRSGKDVLCVETGEMVNASWLSGAKNWSRVKRWWMSVVQRQRRIREIAKLVVSDPREALRRAKRRFGRLRGEGRGGDRRTPIGP